MKKQMKEDEKSLFCFFEYRRNDGQTTDVWVNVVIADNGFCFGVQAVLEQQGGQQVGTPPAAALHSLHSPANSVLSSHYGQHFVPNNKARWGQ